METEILVYGATPCGIAAAPALGSGRPVHEIDIPALQESLRQAGVHL